VKVLVLLVFLALAAFLAYELFTAQVDNAIGQVTANIPSVDVSSSGDDA
jgi:hypothetical protein